MFVSFVIFSMDSKIKGKDFYGEKFYTFKILFELEIYISDALKMITVISKLLIFFCLTHKHTNSRFRVSAHGSFFFFLVSVLLYDFLFNQTIIAKILCPHPIITVPNSHIIGKFTPLQKILSTSNWSGGDGTIAAGTFILYLEMCSLTYIVQNRILKNLTKKMLSVHKNMKKYSYMVWQYNVSKASCPK